MDFKSPQKYTKYTKAWTLVRLKIPKGRELGVNTACDNHQLTRKCEDDLFPSQPSS